MVDSPRRILDLSEKRRALADAVLRGEGVQVMGKEQIPVRADTERIPLSFAQQRLWFMDQLQPRRIVYNVPAAVRVAGVLLLPALQHALNALVARHEVLRTTFATRDGQPVQVVAASLRVPLSVRDLRSLPAHLRFPEAQRLASIEAQLPFDLEHGPLLRASLIRLADNDQLLVLILHHIVSDGWSMGIVLRDLGVLYQSACIGRPAALPSLPIQYADFAVWQREWLQGELLQQQLGYWTHQLSDAPPVLELPTDHPRPAIQSFRGGTQPFHIPAALTSSLKLLSQAHAATLFMTLLAAFDVLLHRYTAQHDIVVGTPIANRTRSELENLVGFFVNSLVLRTTVQPRQSFSSLLAHVREVTLAAYAHQDLPFEKLVEELQPHRDLSHNPLFQVMFVLQNAPTTAWSTPASTTPPRPAPTLSTDTAKFDLTWSLAELPGGALGGALEYNADLFEPHTIARLSGHLTTLLESIALDPHQPIASLPLLTRREQHQLLVNASATHTPFPHLATLHQLVQQQAARTPAAIALVFNHQQLTYQQLDQRANQLAQHLLTLGITPEARVGVCLERSLDLVVAVLGVLKAGGAYVPLDPSYPAERLAFMLRDSNASVLLTQHHLRTALPDHDAHLVCVDDDWSTIASRPAEPPPTTSTATNLAYVMYTSGSTGTPKGVAVEHRGLVALMCWGRDLLDAEERSTMLASSSVCFDSSVWELFLPLCWGTTCVLAENVLQIHGLEVTAVNTVPSAVPELLRTGGLPDDVRVTSLAGEPLSGACVEQLFSASNVRRVVNLYGLTEVSVYSTFAEQEPSSTSSPAIGRPVPNTQVYVVDRHDQLVPIGVPGELLIGGVGLARGYLHRPDLTAQRFVPDPFGAQPGARLYRTGDLVRWRNDGALDFLGRLDHQIKLRGFRIEPAEVELALTQHDAVNEAVVIAHEDVTHDKRLVAYVVPVPGQAPLTASELREFLKSRVPEYMLPASYVVFEALPRTPNGKLDRAALPTPDVARPQLADAFVAPRIPIEDTLAAIWSDVLQVERIGVHDNFFELGGHSLLATQVVSRIRDALHVELPLRTLFESPTIAQLATALATRAERGNAKPVDVPISPIARDEYRLRQAVDPGNGGARVQSGE